MFNFRLKEVRQAAKMTQTQLAESAGVKMRTVQDWEKGLSTPTVKQLAALVDDIDIVYVLTGVRLSDAARHNIALMLKTTADTDPAGDSELSALAVKAAFGVAEAAQHEAAEQQRLNEKIRLLDQSGRLAVESMIDALLAKK